MRRIPHTQPAKLGVTRRGGRILRHRDARPPGREKVTEVATGGQVREPWIDTTLATNPWWQRDGIRRENDGEHVAQHYDSVADSYEPLVFLKPGRPLIPRDPPETWSEPLWEAVAPTAAAASPDDDQPEA